MRGSGAIMVGDDVPMSVQFRPFGLDCVVGVTGGRFGSGAVTTSTTAPGAKTHEGASA